MAGSVISILSRGGEVRMREKRVDRITISLTDTELVELDSLLQKMEDRHSVPVVLTRSLVAHGLVARALAALEQEQNVSRPLSSVAGKILRVKRSQLRQRASNVA
jgi:hypothetical protein